MRVLRDCWRDPDHLKRGSEDDYGPVFSPADFQRLADLLAEIRGRFVLSINDTPEVREVFRRFAFETAETTYSLNKGDPGRFGELIIQG